MDILISQYAYDKETAKEFMIALNKGETTVLGFRLTVTGLQNRKEIDAVIKQLETEFDCVGICDEHFWSPIDEHTVSLSLGYTTKNVSSESDILAIMEDCEIHLLTDNLYLGHYSYIEVIIGITNPSTSFSKDTLEDSIELIREHPRLQIDKSNGTVFQ